MAESLTEPRTAAGRDAPAVRASGVLALALLGDALLYLVLPIHAEHFGVSAAWVGVLLSANRFARLGINPLLVPLSRHVSLASLTLLGAAAASLSTLGYALLYGGAALLAARLVWGFAYSALRLTTLTYATQSPTAQGRLLGWTHAISQAGPLAAVTVGAVLAAMAGPRVAFAVLGVATALGIGLALPLRKSPALRSRAAAPRRRWSPRRIDAAVLLDAVATDGVFMVIVTPLLVHAGSSTDVAVQLGGLVLAVRRGSSLMLGPVLGAWAERFGVRRLYRASLAVVGVALAVAASGAPLAGLLVAALAMTGVHAFAPGVAVERLGEGERLRALAAVTTSRDLGAAVGALAGGTLAAFVAPALVVAGGAVLVLAALAMAGVGRREPRPSDRSVRP